MQTFNEFFQNKINEQGYMSKPAVKIAVNKMKYSFEHPMLMPKFSDNDPDDVSHKEQRTSYYTGFVEVPVMQEAKNEAMKKGMDIKKFIDFVFGLEPMDPMFQKFVDDAPYHLYDLENAQFDDEKLPNFETIPDGLLDAVGHELQVKLQNGDYEVLYA
jgi:hypothetical protein